MADLIMNTKNEKIFQESILLAIRLLDGGNTEIQVPVVAMSPWDGLCVHCEGPSMGRMGAEQSSVPGWPLGSRLCQHLDCICLLTIWGRNYRHFSVFEFSSSVTG